MKPLHRGLLVAVLQVALVCLLGAKYAIDRATLPRVWAEVAPYDPDLPIRGRYVRLQVIATPRGFENAMQEGQHRSWGRATLSVEDEVLIATRSNQDIGQRISLEDLDGEIQLRLTEAVAFFIPEHVPDPSLRPNLRVDVTIPRKGPPRPIRLGVEEGGETTPLDLD